MTQLGRLWTIDADLSTMKVHEPGAGANKNFGFASQREGSVVYHPAASDVISSGADDCTSIFVDNRLVIGLDDHHTYADQSFQLNRVNGLQDGRRYNIKVFYAERTKTVSRIHLETFLDLNAVEMPQASCLFEGMLNSPAATVRVGRKRDRSSLADGTRAIRAALGRVDAVKSPSSWIRRLFHLLLGFFGGLDGRRRGVPDGRRGFRGLAVCFVAGREGEGADRRGKRDQNPPLAPLANGT
jgi:fibro-slime domain-containing protein